MAPLGPAILVSIAAYRAVKAVLEYLSLLDGARWHHNKFRRMFLNRRNWRAEAHLRGVKCPVRGLRRRLHDR